MSRRFFTIFMAPDLCKTDLEDFKAQLAEFYKNPHDYTICTNFNVEIIQFVRFDFHHWTFRCPRLLDTEVTKFREDLRKAVLEESQDFIIAVGFQVEATYMEVD